MGKSVLATKVRSVATYIYIHHNTLTQENGRNKVHLNCICLYLLLIVGVTWLVGVRTQ